MTVNTARLVRFSSPRLRLKVDAAVAIAIAVAQALAMVASGGSGIGARMGGVVCAVGFVCLAWRSRYPLAVLVATFAAVFAQELFAPLLQSPILFLAILIASYSLGAHARSAPLVAGILLGMPAVAVGHALGPPVHEFSGLAADAYLFGLLVLAPAVLGRIVRARVELAARLAAAGDRLDALREQRVSGEVARERDRIVSELEGVMLGGLGVMAAHAEAASLEQISTLERAARETLGAMRKLLAGLRSGRHELSPSRSLASLHDRVAIVLATDGDPGARPLGVETTSPVNGGAALRRRGAVLSPPRVDLGLALLAGLLACDALVTTLASGSQHGPRVIDASLVVATVAPIAWARRATWPAAAVAIAALLTHSAVAMPSDPLSGVTPTGLLVCFPLALGACQGIRGASVGLLLCLGAATLLPVVDPRASSDAQTELATTAAIVVGVWAAGRVLAARSRLLSSLANAAIEIDCEQQALVHERLVEERSRVARDLHDAFAHSMTVIVLQAGAARRVWNTDRELAHQHATILRDRLRAELGELRELILALAHHPEHAPAVLLVEGLVGRARASGMQVELALSGERRSAAREAQWTVYRIVQEALTNAAKHAPGATVRVGIHNAHDRLSIMVENGPPVRPPEAGNASGHGLRGMRERVAACGGTITADPIPEGGFRIAASLPLGAP